MREHRRWLLVAVTLLIGTAAWAQERRPGWLGVELQDVTREEADKLGWEAPRGAKVVRQTPGSPAAAAGIEPGDTISTLDGVEIKDVTDLTRVVVAKGAGTSVRLRLIRTGKERTVAVTLGERPGASVAGAEKQPQLMLDAGGHMALVTGVAFTPDGKQIVSSSQDKVVRVWDVDTGKTVRFIRGQTGPGDWGAIHALALSPDGRWLAVAGALHNSDFDLGGAVRLYDFASGKLETLLKGHSNTVLALAFSPDGKRLVSGGFDKTAIAWDLATRQPLHRLYGHSGRVTDVAFTSDGERAVTGSSDQTVRVWSVADGTQIAEMTEHKHVAERTGAARKFKPLHAGVTSIATSGPLIASASEDGHILLWDARTGNYLRDLFAPALGGTIGATRIHAIGFSPDGRWLLSSHVLGGCIVNEVASGLYLVDGKLRPLPPERNNRFEDIPCSAQVAFTSDGRLAASGYNSIVQVLDATSPKLVKSLQNTGTVPYMVAFADDGRSIVWGYAMFEFQGKGNFSRRVRLPSAGTPLGQVEEVEMRLERKSRDKAQHGAFLASYRSHGPLTVYMDKIEIFNDGKPHGSIDFAGGGSGYIAPIQFTPDGQTVVVGTTMIGTYDLNGRPLGSFVGHFGQVRDVAVSPDGRLLLSASSDQTVRLWNFKTRELIVTVFRGSDGEWVMWTSQGYYTGSPGADKIVGWQINKGPEQTPDYVGADQLRQHLHRPDIVEKAIVLASAEEAVRQAPGTSLKLADLLARPVPRFKVVAPAAASTQRGGRAGIRIAIKATPDPVRLIRVQVNGRQVEEQTPEADSGGFGAGERTLDVPLARGRNEVRIALTNAVGESAETLVLAHEGDGALDTRGTLHILAIGVNEYKGLGDSCGGASCDLKYPVADARRIAHAIEKRLGPGHARVVKRVLTNGGDGKDAPTATNIIDAVELLRRAKENDTVVLFIAGHGTNDGPDYRFLPTDAERLAADGTGWSLRGSTVVPWQVLQSAVEAAKGRRILLVDTCHSGNAYNQRLGNAAYHANIVAYTAARFDQEALEDASLGHGLFTYAVVEALDGKGEIGTKRRISTRDLAGYVVSRVGALAKAMNGEQEPQYFKGRDADDYVLAQW